MTGDPVPGARSDPNRPSSSRPSSGRRSSGRPRPGELDSDERDGAQPEAFGPAGDVAGGDAGHGAVARGLHHDQAVARLTVLGGGRMGSALIGGLIASGFASPDELAVVERREEVRGQLAHDYPGVAVTPTLGPVGAVVLAVEPKDTDEACRLLRAAGCSLLLSVVAGVRIERLESLLADGTPVIRVMPNTPALVRVAASAISPGHHAREADLDFAEQVLSSIGIVVRLPEPLLDAVTALSGSGPAYIFLIAESMIDAGVYLGLDREVSRLLVTQTILGAGRMLTETGEPPSRLRSAVTSPGGTTATGLAMLERRGVRAALLEAVEAAATRCKTLG